MLAKNNFVCVNTGAPTRQNYNGTMSHIDVTFTSKTLGSKCTWGVINNCMGSDHLPTYTKVCEAPFLEPNPEPKFRMQTANWVDFKEGCKIHLAQQLANSDIDTFAHSVQHAIITAAELAIKVAKPGNRNKRAKQLPYWNDQITSAVKQRNKARNKANRSRLPNDCDNYRRLKGQCQRLIKSTAKQHWHDYCSTLNTSTKLSTVWAMSRKMNGVDSNKAIPTLQHNNQIYDTNKSKAELLATTFANVSSSQNYSAAFKANKTETERRYKDILNESTDISEGVLNAAFNINELRRAIRSAKTKSAPGEDKINYTMLQHVPKSGLKIILRLYNQIWSTGDIPTQFKHAIINPVHKPNKDPPRRRLLQTYLPNKHTRQNNGASCNRSVILLLGN